MMNTLKAPSLQSLLESDRGSNDSLLAESLQLDYEELDDVEYSIPALSSIPTLESVLCDLDGDSDIQSEAGGMASATPTPSMDEALKMGTILKHVTLQGVSSQIGSATDRINAGLASSVAIADMIAVGTSHGHILAFDIQQTLRWCCQEYTTQGAVSALAFNVDSTRLLAGFARGHIIMIDSATGDTIRSMVDVITPNSGVLNLKWTEGSAAALCSDSGGSVWTLKFTRRLGIRGCDSRCIFSGARGEVCAVEPLHITGMEHPLKQFSIVALATLSKFVVVTIRPRLKVIKSYPMPGPPDCLPLLAWQVVLIQLTDKSRVVDPVLATVRGNNLYFHRLCVKSGKMGLLFLRHITLGHNLLALHWLGPQTIAYLDTTEILHLKDVSSNKDLECVDMSGAGLVYGSAQFKGFATGGNVSPALALAGAYACYNSIISHRAHLYILGGRSLHSITIRSWSDRISHLVANQRWVEACSLAINGYKVAGKRLQRRQIVKDRTLQMVDEYLEATARCPELCLDVIINCLIEVEAYDVLWLELWDRLTVTDNYLLYLTEHIEDGRLTEISPVIAQSLCEFWLKHDPDKLENLILLLDWKCLDLHQLLTASKREKLFKAQIYLNTNALGDFTISLTELIPQILHETPDLGNNILVYISSCLAGRGYPSGSIDEENIPNVKHEVLRCLTSVHSKCASDNELSYPYLRTLLKFDTRETLNVLALAFQEKEFSGELGRSHRQRIVNILLEIISPDSATWSEVGCLLNFVSQQISSRNLPEDTMLLNKVMNYLKMENISNETARQHAEREQAWLSLLETDCLSHISNSEHLKMAKAAKCYCVMEYLLEKRKSFDDILNCYLLDANRHLEMWTYIDKHASTPDRKLYPQIYENLVKCLEINATELTRILIDHFRDKIDECIHLLDNNDNNLYLFLDNLLRQHITLSAHDSEQYLSLLCQFNPENVEQFLRSNENYRLENALDIVRRCELYVCTIYLYEKQGDFNAAFNLSLDLLKEAPESTAESQALELSSLCSRASEVLAENQREQLWFSFLNTILPRPDLTLITKNILHAASGHVDLTKLVQLVLSSAGTSTSNFGDIKHLIVGMLANSRYETQMLAITSKTLGLDLHHQLVKAKQKASQGVLVRPMKCVVCRQRLYNQHDVIVFGSCGHAVHKECSDTTKKTVNNDKLQCPRCGIIVIENEQIRLAQPTNEIIEESILANTLQKEGVLQLEAPPRIGIGGK